MEVTKAHIGFKCPNCLRDQQVNLDPEEIEVSVGMEPCPVHLSHIIVGFNFACPNCSTKVLVEMVDSGLPDLEEDDVS